MTGASIKISDCKPGAVLNLSDGTLGQSVFAHMQPKRDFIVDAEFSGNRNVLQLTDGSRMVSVPADMPQEMQNVAVARLALEGDHDWGYSRLELTEVTGLSQEKVGIALSMLGPLLSHKTQLVCVAGVRPAKQLGGFLASVHAAFTPTIGN